MVTDTSSAFTTEGRKEGRKVNGLPLRRGAIVALMAASLFFPFAGQAMAGAQCNHGAHTDYHFPYAHRDTWYYQFSIDDGGHHEQFYSPNDGGKWSITGHC